MCARAFAERERERERERGCKEKYVWIFSQVPLTQVFARASITTTKRERKRALSQ